jgi:hypothetical protein
LQGSSRRTYRALGQQSDLSMVDHLRLVDALLVTDVEHVSQGATGDAWTAIGVAISAVHDAITTGDGAALGAAVATLTKVHQAAHPAVAAHRAIDRRLRVRARLLDSELRRCVVGREFLSRATVLAYCTALTDEIRRQLSLHAPAVAMTVAAAIADFVRRDLARPALERGI